MIEAASIYAGSTRLVQNLNFMPRVRYAENIAGAPANCVASTKPWRAEFATEGARVEIPRLQFALYDEASNRVTFRQSARPDIVKYRCNRPHEWIISAPAHLTGCAAAPTLLRRENAQGRVMNRQIERHRVEGQSGAPLAKFSDPDWTATGERRARVGLRALKTLWFNTGTLCNIACENCYILSSPTNDALAYLNLAEVETYLDEIATLGLPTGEMGFTGGEPFLNPDLPAMADAALERGHRVLILTNAMRPMMRKAPRKALASLAARFGERLVLRVSLDHYAALHHDAERGVGSFAASLAGMRWLRDNGVRMTVAGRTIWGEDEVSARAGYAALFAAEGFAIDAADRSECVLFPEMDDSADVPEISAACWGVLNKRPDDVMCATSRMVVKRRAAARPVVLACTLLAYDPRFELGHTLAEAQRTVSLNHPHCAKFCVLGGATCSA